MQGNMVTFYASYSLSGSTYSSNVHGLATLSFGDSLQHIADATKAALGDLLDQIKEDGEPFPETTEPEKFNLKLGVAPDTLDVYVINDVHSYYGKVIEGAEGHYVTLHELPEIQSEYHGETRQQAIENATKALLEFLPEYMREHGELPLRSEPDSFDVEFVVPRDTLEVRVVSEMLGN